MVLAITHLNSIEFRRSLHGVFVESMRSPHELYVDSMKILRGLWGLHEDVWGSVKYSQSDTAAEMIHMSLTRLVRVPKCDYWYDVVMNATKLGVKLVLQRNFDSCQVCSPWHLKKVKIKPFGELGNYSLQDWKGLSCYTGLWVTKIMQPFGYVNFN